MTAPSITCPKCGRTSYNPNDIEQGYCGYCHDWVTARVGPKPEWAKDKSLVKVRSCPLPGCGMMWWEHDDSVLRTIAHLNKFHNGWMDDPAPERPISRWQLFRNQYKLCRTRELTRPLGVLHAFKHAWKAAWS